MAKKKKELFEKPNFSDVANAQDVFNTSVSKLEKNERAKMPAIIGSVVGAIVILIGVLQEMGKVDVDITSIIAVILFVVAAIISIVTYIMMGTIAAGLKGIWKMTIIGKNICPWYILDLITAYIGLVIGVCSFLLLPIIYWGMNKKELLAKRDAAALYAGMASEQ